MVENDELLEREYPLLPLGPTSIDYMCKYGINIILQRAIPYVTDGMKPIMRRVLYAMWRTKRDKLMKVAEIQGEVMKFSPHSELGTRFIVASMAQPFSNNAPYLTPKGNCGTPTTGDDCAAARYWDARVSDFAMDVFFSEFDGKVNMKPNYDGEYMEPITLPARFPTILLNGSNGIAYTMSSDILPYNLSEVADATVKLLKNPEAKVNLIPDSPTGCDILKRDELTFVMQSSYDIDNVNYTITFKNFPFGEYLTDVDKRLSIIQESQNPIKEIMTADNESDLIAGKIRYVIRCKPCNLYKVVQTLFKRVPGFRVTFSMRNSKVIDVDRTQHTYTVRQILLAWIKNRMLEKRSYYLRKLVDVKTEYNMLIAKKFMLSPENLNKTIKVFRACEDSDEIVKSLMDTYKPNVSSSQALYISELKMSRLTHGEYERTLKKIQEHETSIQELLKILQEPEKFKDTIIQDILDIKSKYGTPRKSRIMNNASGESVQIGVCQIMTDGSIVFSETENPDHFASDITPINGDEVCLIDNYGRFLWVDVTKVPHGKPLTLTSIGRQPMDKCIAAVSNKEWSIIMLTNKGRIKLMPINRIPSNQSKKPLIPSLMDGEYLVSVLEVSSDADDLLMYTSDGLGKRFSVSDLNLVMSPDAQGQFIVKENVDASGIFIINGKKPLIFYVTRLGRVRCNALKFLAAGKKFGGLKPIIPLSPQDDLVAAFCCDPSQVVTMYHADGRMSNVNVDSMKPTTMSTPPVKPKHVYGVKVIRATLS